MSFLRPVFITIILLAAASVYSQEPKKIAQVNMRTMYGEAFNTSELDNKGKPMVIIVWRSDRRVCYRYFQELNDALPEYRVEYGVKVVIISIDSPKTFQEVLPMVRAKEWDFESYIDTYQEFKNAMGVVGIPYTFVVNGKGEVVWEKQSYFPGQEEEVYQEVEKAAKAGKNK